MADFPDRPASPERARPQILARGGGATIAYHRLEGAGPGVVFLGGFMSDMSGIKATALEAHCRTAGRAFLRFDYSGHGQSSGAFADGTIGRWTADALAALDGLTDGPQLLVGSSMGGWIMLLAALVRPKRIAGLVGIAAAPDFTEALLWQHFPPEIRTAIERDGYYDRPSHYGGTYRITRALIEDGRKHLLLERAIAVHCPVRLIHGMRDTDVPWEHALLLAERLLSHDVAVTLVKDGDHRLSREPDIVRLCRTVDSLCEEVG